MKPTLAFSKFYLERKGELLQKYVSLEAWMGIIKYQMEEGNTIPGYRDGVILVRTYLPLPHRTVLLTEQDTLIANFKPRVMGEEPRKSMQVYRSEESLPSARTTFVVLYRRDVLNLTGERSSEADWEVIEHLTSALNTPEPMHPNTMLANHFRLSGGTPTGMTPEQFEAALKESVLFWKNRAIAVS